MNHLSNYHLEYLGYGTVREYLAYSKKYPKLLHPKGDLKDVQRPWALEMVRKYVPTGQPVIDMGGAACDLASHLMADYEVTVVDPYDGSSGGASSVGYYKNRYPEVNFVRDVLNSSTDIDQRYRAVASTSVVEHIAADDVFDAVLGIDNALVPGGFSIHAIDFTVRGEGRIKQLTDAVLTNVLASYACRQTLEEIREKMLQDHETYFLSPLMFQQWSKGRSLDEYPWRQVGSFNIVLRKLENR